MAQIKKINIKGVEYDIAGSGGGSGGNAVIVIEKTIESDDTNE